MPHKRSVGSANLDTEGAPFGFRDSSAAGYLQRHDSDGMGSLCPRPYNGPHRQRTLIASLGQEFGGSEKLQNIFAPAELLASEAGPVAGPVARSARTSGPTHPLGEAPLGSSDACSRNPPLVDE